MGGYFQDPTGQGRQTGTTTAGIGETLTVNRKDLQDLKEKLEQVLKQIPQLQRLENLSCVWNYVASLRQTFHGKRCWNRRSNRLAGWAAGPACD